MKKVLIVDDNFINRTLVYSALENDYVVIEAENGEDAMSLIEFNDDISLVISDDIMPVMDGFELMKELSENEYDVPVMMMTSNESATYINDMMKYGASDCLVRPLDVAMISNRVENILSGK